MAVPKLRNSRVFSISTTISHMEKDKEFKLLQKQSNSHTVQTAKMIVVMMVPVIALVSIAGVSMASSQSNYIQTRTAYNSITPSFSLTELIGSLQEERGITTMYLSTESPSTTLVAKMVHIQDNVVMSMTKIATWNVLTVNNVVMMSTNDLHRYVATHRLSLMVKNITFSYNIDFYTNVTLALLEAVTDGIELPAEGDLWKTFVAFDSILRASDACGIQRALGGVFFSMGGLSDEYILHFIRLDDGLDLFMKQCFRYNRLVKAMYLSGYAEMESVMLSLASIKSRIMQIGGMAANSTPVVDQRDVEMGIEWFDNITKYIALLTKLRIELMTDVMAELAAAMSRVRQSFILYICLMVVVVIGCLLLAAWYSNSINTLMRNMSDYSKKMNVSEYTET